MPVYRGRCPVHVRWAGLSPRQRGRALVERRERIMRTRGRACHQCAGPPPLELHHRNGDPSDDRVENLALLCRDCHAVETERLRVAGPEQLTLRMD